LTYESEKLQEGGKPSVSGTYVRLILGHVLAKMPLRKYTFGISFHEEKAGFI
jgi:hypothetical protein